MQNPLKPPWPYLKPSKLLLAIRLPFQTLLGHALPSKPPRGKAWPTAVGHLDDVITYWCESVKTETMIPYLKPDSTAVVSDYSRPWNTTFVAFLAGDCAVLLAWMSIMAHNMTRAWASLPPHCDNERLWDTLMTS